MSPRKLWPLCLTFVLATSSMASSHRPALRAASADSLTARERNLWRAPVHVSEFADVPHTTALSSCERTHPPEALATPNPILGPSDPSVKVLVSFIVGADGRVHSPLILESAGSIEDHTILETVRSWRYRPAMCNGVPTETEAKIEFSTR
jgi:TonB family protein